MGNTKSQYDIEGLNKVKKEQERKNMTASELIEKQMNPNTFKKSMSKMLSLTSTDDNKLYPVSSRSHKKQESPENNQNVKIIKSNKEIVKSNEQITENKVENVSPFADLKWKKIPSIEVNLIESKVLNRVITQESGLQSNEELTVKKQLLRLPTNGTINTLDENSFAISEARMDENCPRCNQAKEIMHYKKETKRLAKNYQKMHKELETQALDLKHSIEFLNQQIQELSSNKQQIEEHVQKYQRENTKIIEKQSDLENHIKESLGLISKKLPKAASLGPQDIKRIAALIETPEDYLIQCLKFNIRLIYDGELDEETESMKHGYGKLMYPNGSVFFSGEFRDDKIFGNIIRLYYESEDENADSRLFLKIQSDSSEKLPIDEINGSVIEYFNIDLQREKFTCGIKNAIPNGKAIEYYDSGCKKFEGIYENGLRNGPGKEFYKNLEKELVHYDGTYSNNLRDGMFTEYFENGTEKFVGHFKNDVKHGEGKLYYENGQILYEPYNDTNSLNYKNNVLVWTNGHLNGESVMWYNSDGSLIAKGLDFKNGKIIGTAGDCYLYFQNGKNWMFRNALYNENGNIHINQRQNTHEYRDLIIEKEDLWGEQYFQTFMSPSLIFKYIGTYNDGKREGYGKYLWGTDVLFDGFWKENLPYKNYEKKFDYGDGIVVFWGVSLTGRGGLKINPQFKGTVHRDPKDGWLYGECEVFDPFREDFKIRLYKGKYRAPTLDSLLLLTLDLELCDYDGLLPKHNSLVLVK